MHPPLIDNTGVEIDPLNSSVRSLRDAGPAIANPSDLIATQLRKARL